MGDRGSFEALTLHRASLDAVAWCRVMSIDPSAAGFVVSLVEAGQAYVLDARQDDASVATLIVEEAETEYGRELVVLACAGEPAGAALSPLLLAALEIQARIVGCGVVRFHTRRGGLIERAKRAGYSVSEIVLRKAVEARV